MEWELRLTATSRRANWSWACFLLGIVREQEPGNFASEMSGCRKQQKTKAEVSRQKANATVPRLTLRSSL